MLIFFQNNLHAQAGNWNLNNNILKGGFEFFWNFAGISKSSIQHMLIQFISCVHVYLHLFWDYINLCTFDIVILI